MVDKEDEKRQFTINVSSVNQLDGPVRDRLGTQEEPPGGSNTGSGTRTEGGGGDEQVTTTALLKELLSRTKAPVAVLLLALVIGGITLTYLPEPSTAAVSEGTEMVQVSSGNTQATTYEELLEIRMETILENLDGAGKAKVMITTSGSTEKVVAEEVVQNKQGTEETTGSGSKKTSEKEDVERKVVMEKGGTPFVVKENKPQVEGVLVLAEGADDANIKNAIIQSVSSLLDVPVHKIAVYKMVNN